MVVNPAIRSWWALAIRDGRPPNLRHELKFAFFCKKEPPDVIGSQSVQTIWTWPGGLDAAAYAATMDRWHLCVSESSLDK